MTSLSLVLSDKSRWHLQRGDCLAVLRELPDASVDAIVTDGPYSSGGLFAGDRAKAPSKKYVQNGGLQAHMQRPDFAGDTRDQRSFLAWCALWLSECFRVARDGAPICIFSDWRQVPISSDALQAGGWIWRGMVPWDKTEAARPQKGRFRNQAEYILWGSKGPMPVERGVGVLPGVIRAPVRKGEKFHLTGKPVKTMRDAVQICAPGGVVLDPFAGSGTTGVACLREELRFVGIEITEVYATVAQRRLRMVEAGASDAQIFEELAELAGVMPLRRSSRTRSTARAIAA